VSFEVSATDESFISNLSGDSKQTKKKLIKDKKSKFKKKKNNDNEEEL